MAASAWKIFWTAKNRMGLTGFNLGTAAGFRMSLHKTAASALLSGSAVSKYSSIGNTAASAGCNLSVDGQVLSNPSWALSAGSTWVWDIDDEVFTPTAAACTSIRYAVIRLSVGAASGYPLCYAALSTTAFPVGDGSSLTVQMAGTGVFTLT